MTRRSTTFSSPPVVRRPRPGRRADIALAVFTGTVLALLLVSLVIGFVKGAKA